MYICELWIVYFKRNKQILTLSLWEYRWNIFLFLISACIPICSCGHAARVCVFTRGKIIITHYKADMFFSCMWSFLVWKQLRMHSNELWIKPDPLDGGAQYERFTRCLPLCIIIVLRFVALNEIYYVRYANWKRTLISSLFFLLSTAFSCSIPFTRVLDFAYQ